LRFTQVVALCRRHIGRAIRSLAFSSPLKSKYTPWY